MPYKRSFSTMKEVLQGFGAFDARSVAAGTSLLDNPIFSESEEWQYFKVGDERPCRHGCQANEIYRPFPFFVGIKMTKEDPGKVEIVGMWCPRCDCIAEARKKARKDKIHSMSEHNFRLAVEQRKAKIKREERTAKFIKRVEDKARDELDIDTEMNF